MFIYTDLTGFTESCKMNDTTLMWRHDTQHNGIQDNDTQYNI